MMEDEAPMMNLKAPKSRETGRVTALEDTTPSPEADRATAGIGFPN